jgi:SAM-dependent methyltransferase
MDWCKPVKILVAGGGTGEKTVQLAQQMFDSHSSSNWRITHLDLSQTSIDIAKARAIDIWGSEAVQNHLKFVQGSLLNVVDLLPYEEFDYIDCLGVLHTLHNPAHGLSMLKRVLKTNGGIGIMVYAPLGRAGIYNMQNMINMIKDSSSTQYNIN